MYASHVNKNLSIYLYNVMAKSARLPQMLAGSLYVYITLILPNS